ncbi:hypothetical protein CSQ79_19835 [Gloeocapsopsis sp. IPPAS B-1203]|nr:hypothetical protein CSQ79_19835 [Gloeocapsopsis sp. IPPAS B-1203]
MQNQALKMYNSVFRASVAEQTSYVLKLNFNSGKLVEAFVKGLPCGFLTSTNILAFKAKTTVNNYLLSSIFKGIYLNKRRVIFIVLKYL